MLLDGGPHAEHDLIALPPAGRARLDGPPGAAASGRLRRQEKNVAQSATKHPELTSDGFEIAVETAPNRGGKVRLLDVSAQAGNFRCDAVELGLEKGESFGRPHSVDLAEAGAEDQFFNHRRQGAQDLAAGLGLGKSDDPIRIRDLEGQSVAQRRRGARIRWPGWLGEKNSQGVAGRLETLEIISQALDQRLERGIEGGVEGGLETLQALTDASRRDQPTVEALDRRARSRRLMLRLDEWAHSEDVQSRQQENSRQHAQSGAAPTLLGAEQESVEQPAHGVPTLGTATSDAAISDIGVVSRPSDFRALRQAARLVSKVFSSRRNPAVSVAGKASPAKLSRT